MQPIVLLRVNMRWVPRCLFDLAIPWRSVRFLFAPSFVAQGFRFTTPGLMQGPGKRPAVFSHDKLVWELCSDALEAFRVQNGVTCTKAPFALHL